MNTTALLSVCKHHAELAPPNVVLKEPYIPFIPAAWNGVLVLAEAQNLGSPDSPYMRDLSAMSTEQRMCRLTELADEDGIGVGPWDSGPLQFAVAALGYDPSSTGVSNAVPWSIRKGAAGNANPSREMEKRASAFWADILPALEHKTKLVVTVGSPARRVMASQSGLQERCIALRSASPNLVQRVQGMFGTADLLARYPEITDVASRLERPEWLENSSYVFYVAHAISISAGHVHLRGASPVK